MPPLTFSPRYALYRTATCQSSLSSIFTFASPLFPSLSLPSPSPSPSPSPPPSTLSLLPPLPPPLANRPSTCHVAARDIITTCHLLKLDSASGSCHVDTRGKDKKNGKLGKIEKFEKNGKFANFGKIRKFGEFGKNKKNEKMGKIGKFGEIGNFGESGKNIVLPRGMSTESQVADVPRGRSWWYREIPEEEVGDGRIVIVGDIHGCLDEFEALLEKCQFESQNDTLILVGDLGNKGPKSAEVIRFARQLDARTVRGNHDEKVLADVAQGKDETWISQLSKDDVAWLENLPYTLTVPSYGTVVVHGGLIPNLDIEKQPLKEMTIMRYIKRRDEVRGRGREGEGEGKGGDGGGEGGEGERWEVCGEGEEGGVLWGTEWKGSRHVFFGHDAARGLQLYDKATGLDTGCCYGGRLTACVLPRIEDFKKMGNNLYSKDKPLGGDLVQVSAFRTYEASKKKKGGK